jgi:hypothetical protein
VQPELDSQLAPHGEVFLFTNITRTAGQTTTITRISSVITTVKNAAPEAPLSVGGAETQSDCFFHSTLALAARLSEQSAGALVDQGRIGR